jgi:hypothetical protein
MILIGTRLIDLAIFGTLGTLWVGGAIFIVTVWRWVIAFEREEGGTPSQPAVTATRRAASSPTATSMVAPEALVPGT